MWFGRIRTWLLKANVLMHQGRVKHNDLLGEIIMESKHVLTNTMLMIIIGDIVGTNFYYALILLNSLWGYYIFIIKLYHRKTKLAEANQFWHSRDLESTLIF